MTIWSYTNGSEVKPLFSYELPYLVWWYMIEIFIGFLKDCSLKILCGEFEIPSVSTTNAAGNSSVLLPETSLPSSVTASPNG